MFPVFGAALGAAGTGLLVLGNPFGPLSAGRARRAGRVQKARAQKTGNELKFVG